MAAAAQHGPRAARSPAECSAFRRARGDRQRAGAPTAGSARLTRSPAGTLRAGTPADLAVLSAAPFGLDPAGPRTVGADLTVVGGRVVFERKGTVAGSVARVRSDFNSLCSVGAVL
ncbi:amidohydrolase family protein [Arthrobacter burdickii]|uniref:Amidohydrolase family protein n=1 Tax=Arthrobacter burdickii TaxID=3035920 RepID=A0ABT8K5Z1_9MICC|nr:amidohydrolase family protein [Arthrobacter burdickii]MDN4612418.1 amidohydrolase family protein [Arthrobacter burdickii]